MSIVRTAIQFVPPPSKNEIMAGPGVVPVGTIVAWVPGYITDGSNTDYVQKLGLGNDNVSDANSYLNTMGWRVCDGTSLSDNSSPIFYTEGVTVKYTPNLTDKRFLQGSFSVKVKAGEVDTWNILNSLKGSTNFGTDHTHALSGSMATSGSTTHNHVISGTIDSAGQSAHNHVISGSIDSGGQSSHTHTNVYFARSGMAHTHTATLNGNMNQLNGFISSNGAHSHVITHNAATTPAGGTLAFGSGCLVTAATITTDYVGGHVHTLSSATFYTSGTSDGASWSGNQTVSLDAMDIRHTHPVNGTAGTLVNAAADISHIHGNGTLSIGTNSAPGSTENRPQYLRCFMIIRYK